MIPTKHSLAEFLISKLESIEIKYDSCMIDMDCIFIVTMVREWNARHAEWYRRRVIKLAIYRIYSYQVINIYLIKKMKMDGKMEELNS